MSNRLRGETSPYLLQHADNPVDWYPWGEEAFDRARRENRPVFLSIGYSACHWCHVMERESFTNPETAELLNDRFVSVKVDREERPDLDAIYMQAVTALTGQGGWPLSVWLTPARIPFYGGTYFPDVPRHGSPSFAQVLRSLAQLWSTRRDDVDLAANRLIKHLWSAEEPRTGSSIPVPAVQMRALEGLEASYDPAHGGWGTMPKFPQPLVLEYLLALQAANDQPPVKAQLDKTLEAMALGGINDQIAGGFHRYSTDDRWLVPHFEKMLYDNAQLARCYLHAWQLTGNPLYQVVAQDTLDFMLREMRHPGGGFFSSHDADSEGREGTFFLWTPAELRAVLTLDEADLISRVYGVTSEGNFEGANVLHRVAVVGDDVEGLGAARAKLRAARDSRPRPARDDKVIAGWNGLALAAFAEAGRQLPEGDRYVEAAEECAAFVARELMRPGDRLFHSWRDGRAQGNALLDDYALIIEGLLALYQTTFHEERFATARALTDSILLHFRANKGGFYDTSHDHEELILRPRSLQDTPTPSGNSAAVTALLQIAAYTGDGRYADVAQETLTPMRSLMAAAPLAFGRWLLADHLLQQGFTEVAIVGPWSHPTTQGLLEAARKKYDPALVVALAAPGHCSVIPLLQDRDASDVAPRAWVCRGRTCLPPSGTAEDLAAQLG